MLKEYDVKVTLSKIVIVKAESEREACRKAEDEVNDFESEIEDSEVIEDRDCFEAIIAQYPIAGKTSRKTLDDNGNIITQEVDAIFIGKKLALYPNFNQEILFVNHIQTGLHMNSMEAMPYDELKEKFNKIEELWDALQYEETPEEERKNISTTKFLEESHKLCFKNKEA